MDQTHQYSPQLSDETLSIRLWPAIIATLNTAMTDSGRNTKYDNTTIDQPMAQMTWPTDTCIIDIDDTSRGERR